MSVITGLPDGLVDVRKLTSTRFTVRQRPNNREALPTSPAAAAKEMLTRQMVVDRDMHLLELMYNARPVLTRDHIQRIFWPQGKSDRATSHRLQLLFQRHVLNRNPNAILATADVGMEPSSAYFLGIVGKRLLALQRGNSKLDTSHVRSYGGYSAPTMLVHDLMVSEIYTLIWETIRGNPNANLVWVSEWASIIRNNKGKEIVRPDALIILKSEKQQQFIFLEMERNPHVTKLKAKIARYETAATEGVWRDRYGMTEFPSVGMIVQKKDMQKVKNAVSKHRKNVRWRLKTWPVTDFFTGWEIFE